MRHLIQPATPAQRDAYDDVERVVALVQPALWSGLLAMLFLAGCVASYRLQDWRPGLLVALSAVALLLTCTIFSGAVPRFRYPADPFLYTVAAGGAAAILRLTHAASQRIDPSSRKSATGAPKTASAR